MKYYFGSWFAGTLRLDEVLIPFTKLLGIHELTGNAEARREFAGDAGARREFAGDAEA